MKIKIPDMIYNNIKHLCDDKLHIKVDDFIVDLLSQHQTACTILQVMDAIKLLYVSDNGFDEEQLITDTYNLMNFSNVLENEVPDIYHACAHQIVVDLYNINEKQPHKHWMKDDKSVVIFRTPLTDYVPTGDIVSVENTSEVANDKISILNEKSDTYRYFSQRCPKDEKISTILQTEPNTTEQLYISPPKPQYKYSVIQASLDDIYPTIIHTETLQPAYVLCRELKQRWLQEGCRVLFTLKDEKRYSALKDGVVMHSVKIVPYCGDESNE